MNKVKLQRNVQFLYEEHLAQIELRAFGCDSYQRDLDNPWEFTAHLNGKATSVRERSAYVGSVDDELTVYEQLIKPAYQGGKYNRTRSVNQYLTHWIYPYRGKFHPQMVRALLNILQVKSGSMVVEPFLGSGTTAVEASLLGAHCTGVDRSPVCVLLTRVKTQSYLAVDAIRARVRDLQANPNLDSEAVNPLEEQDSRVGDFLQVAKLVTSSDVARRGRERDAAFQKNIAAMLESVEAYAKAVHDFGLSPGNVLAVEGDARNLESAGIRPDSADAIVTSPPYSLALDYVKNDEHALTDLGVNLTQLREEMIGVRGKGKERKHNAYNADMQVVFTEVARILKPGAAAAFVIGDATMGGSEVTTTREMVEWAESSGLLLERDIPKIVFGLYNVMQDEHILIFRKG